MEYSFASYNPDHMARAALKDAPISFKKSIEVAKRVRGMMSDKAEKYLERVIALEEPVPFTRYPNGAGHRRGPMAAGKYPIKVATAFLQLIKLGVANAENKGLGTPLKIVHLSAQKAATPAHHGRMRGHVMKRAHVELVLAETEESKRHEKKAKKPAKEMMTTPVAQPKVESNETKAETKVETLVKHDTPDKNPDQKDQKEVEKKEIKKPAKKTENKTPDGKPKAKPKKIDNHAE